MDIDIDLTCRVCLENRAISNIFSHNGILKGKTCHEIMKTLFSFPIIQGDGLPPNICKKCHTKLWSAYKLTVLAEDSNRKLVDFLSGVAGGPMEDADADTAIKLKREDVELECDDINAEEIFSSEANLTADIKVEKDESAESEDDNTPLKVVRAAQQSSAEDFINCQSNKTKTLIKKKCGRRKTEEGRRGREAPTVCDLCGKLVADIAIHKRVHSAARRQIPCGDCPKVFTNHSGRRRHRAVHHLGLSYFCQLCNKSFKRGEDHRRAVHPTKPKDFLCVLCDKRFYTQTELNRHVKYHTEERPFPCPVCHKDFRTQTLCDYHRRSVHEKERTIRCEHCPKSFFNRAELNKHKKCHFAQEKNFMCNECGRRFTTGSQLKVHEKRHAGIKDVVCHICSNAFRTNGGLKSHMLTHTKEKTHPCKYCGVKFGRKDHRNNHEKTVHESKL